MKNVLALIPILIFNLAASAELIEINEDELSEIGGQSIIQLTQIAPCAGGATGCNGTELGQRGYGSGETYQSGDLGFARLEVGATIDINANIGELVLGEYVRSGFSQDADLELNNISLGTIDPVTGALETVTMEDPYIEFAYEEDGSGQPTNIAGFRIGFKNVNGVLGNNIVTLSGDAEVNVFGVPVSLFGVGLGTVNINAQGSLPRSTVLPDLDVSGDSGLIGLLASFDPGLLNALSANQALSEYHTLVATNTENLYVSAANREIYYPRINANSVQNPAQEGFWLNLQDGVTLPGVTLPDAINFDFQGSNPYPVNCFNGNNGNQGGFSGC